MVNIRNLFSCTREAQARLQQQRHRLYRVAYSWSHNAALADDITQEALTKAMQKFSQIRDPESGEAWLFTILSNCYRDHFRRRKETEDIDEYNITTSVTPETDNSEQQTVTRVRLAVATLPEGQRQVVTLVDLEGFSYAEVASILDIPVGTVMSRLCRARRTLKDALLEEYRQISENIESPADTAVVRRIK
ncbi:MAG: sigma-70 family RNA polymerase sigma factor [Gammaproteobacteria bacterium]|nr:sigma-70 family RNA polymerase sigma factor [Gammaproteobacteria bacterium]